MTAARNQYQTNLNDLLGQQTPASMAAGNNLMTTGQQTITAGGQLAGQEQGLMNTAQGIIGQGQGIIGQEAGLMNTGKTIIGQGQALAAQEPGLMQYGKNIADQSQQFLTPAEQFAQQSTTIGQPDISLGQRLISGNQAIDPLVQQELMRSGLGSAASALGEAAALGELLVERQLDIMLELEQRIGLISSDNKEWRCSRLV